jgi:hypothetical protein
MANVESLSEHGPHAPSLAARLYRAMPQQRPGLGPVGDFIASQLRSLSFPILTLYLPTVVLLLVIGWQNKIPARVFTQDPNQLSNLPVFAGLLSNLGILFWCATASVCLFTFTILRSIQDKGKTFFLLAGFLTIGLMVDDLFLFHETIFPKQLGVSEKWVGAAYICVTAIFLAHYRTTIFKTEFFLLVLALVLFSVSVLFDLGSSGLFRRTSFLFEDGSKLLGIMSWFAYFARVCVTRISSTTRLVP